jgi:hypothetical protein
MDPRLDEAIFDRPRKSPSYETLTPVHLVSNYGTKLDKVFILEFFLSLVIEVHEKFK